MPIRHDAEQILTDWREVERDLDAVPEGSPESSALRDEAGRLRDEYQRLVEEARARSHPELPPFPTER